MVNTANLFCYNVFATKIGTVVATSPLHCIRYLVQAYLARVFCVCASVTNDWSVGGSIVKALWPGSVFFFRGTHKVRDDLQLSHFVG